MRLSIDVSTREVAQQIGELDDKDLLVFLMDVSTVRLKKTGVRDEFVDGVARWFVNHGIPKRQVQE